MGRRRAGDSESETSEAPIKVPPLLAGCEVGEGSDGKRSAGFLATLQPRDIYPLPNVKITH